jgi:DNA-binding FadR family transcriptional regulator
VIERYAIEQVIAAPGDVGEALCRLTERQEELTGGEFVEADRAFHRTLVEATGNRILLGLYDSLRDRQRRMGRATLRSPEQMARTLAEHREIADAVAAGNSARALAALRSHLDRALAVLRRLSV